MSGILGVIAAISSGVASMTASATDSAWAATGTTSNIAATARTITVPSGNAGDIKLTKVGTGTVQYSINGGTFTTFANNAVITLTNGQTLNFRISGSGSGTHITGSAIDNTTNATIGSYDIENVS